MTAWLPWVLLFAGIAAAGAREARRSLHATKTPAPPPARGGAGQAPARAIPPPGPGHHRSSHMVTGTWECGCTCTWDRQAGWVHDSGCPGGEIRKLVTP